MIRKFSTGAVRDTDTDKPNFPECFSYLAFWRYGQFMKKASAKYGENNWQKGITKDSYKQSLMRHLVRYLANEQGARLELDTDHLSAALFNLMGLMHEEEKEKLGDNLQKPTIGV
jgi:hypothetical protein